MSYILCYVNVTQSPHWRMWSIMYNVKCCGKLIAKNFTIPMIFGCNLVVRI